MPLRRYHALPALLALGVALTACTGTETYQIPLMPTPEYLDAQTFNPFQDSTLLPADGKPELLYATLRLPAQPDDGARYYSNGRAQLVRLGSATIDASENATWEQLRDIGLIRSQEKKFALRVGAVTEYGALAASRLSTDDDQAARAADAAATARFAAAINANLASRTLKDIVIYVHGYRVNFENPLLVGAELWHFMGYEGLVVPFAWPSRLGRLAYFGDTESSRFSSRGFREFLAFLASGTDVRRIHIIGYSAGTRMVLAAMHELALQREGRDPSSVRPTRIGNVVLVGSDVDLGIVGNHIQDGMLNVAERFTFYESSEDKALGMARRVMGQPRAGQVLAATGQPGVGAFMAALPNLTVVNVESAPFFDTGNGHSYFKDSPRVSSDLLATLRYGLLPEERGLARSAGELGWTFPEDYIERLRRAVADRQAMGPSGAAEAAASAP